MPRSAPLANRVRAFRAVLAVATLADAASAPAQGTRSSEAAIW